ncbi:hypothetical protein AB90_4734 [Escherichia coli 2-427-07_S3_C1]|nr:hypothetical protein AB90_4734 [Escherichia coli 2-427-07_S3_C1]
MADAEAAVKAAEAKKAEADDAAAQADKDGNGLITPEEAKAVEDANVALEAASRQWPMRKLQSRQRKRRKQKQTMLPRRLIRTVTA